MADYSSYKPTLNDADYANKLNNFIDAVQADVNNKLNIADFVAKKVVSTSASYVVQADDYTIEVDANVGNVTVTLPAAASYKGRILVFNRKDATTYRAVIGSYELYLQNETITLQSNGTVWVRIA